MLFIAKLGWVTSPEIFINHTADKNVSPRFAAISNPCCSAVEFGNQNEVGSLDLARFWSFDHPIKRVRRSARIAQAISWIKRPRNGSEARCLQEPVAPCAYPISNRSADMPRRRDASTAVIRDRLIYHSDNRYLPRSTGARPSLKAKSWLRFRSMPRWHHREIIILMECPAD